MRRSTSRACGGCSSTTPPLAFEHAGLDWKDFVDYDARYERPTEVDSLIGDGSKALEELGWKAQVHVPELVRIMVDADLDLLTRED